MAEGRLEVVRRERNLYEQQRDRARAEHQALRDAVQEEIEQLRELASAEQRSGERFRVGSKARYGRMASADSYAAAANRLANLLNEGGGT
jgi:hypothetical protein